MLVMSVSLYVVALYVLCVKKFGRYHLTHIHSLLLIVHTSMMTDMTIVSLKHVHVQQVAGLGQFIKQWHHSISVSQHHVIAANTDACASHDDDVFCLLSYRFASSSSGGGNTI
jgi:hypothetical protein